MTCKINFIKYSLSLSFYTSNSLFEKMDAGELSQLLNLVVKYAGCHDLTEEEHQVFAPAILLVMAPARLHDACNGFEITVKCKLTEAQRQQLRKRRKEVDGIEGEGEEGEIEAEE